MVWDVSFGAKRIGQILAGIPELRFVHEVRTELYRIQLFRREPTVGGGLEPERVDRAPHLPPAPHVAARFGSGGMRGDPDALPRWETRRRPILMYHRVAPDGSKVTGRYRVTPEAFEAQLGYLQDAGFYSVSMVDWLRAAWARRPLAGRAVMLTFDDGFRDFETYAWPLLRRFQFGAAVFLPTGFVGQTNHWDQRFGESVDLLDWRAVVRLASQGVVFGSHSASHWPMTGLSNLEVAQEAARSRSTLERVLGRRVDLFAYPNGDTDPAVQHLVGGLGYTAAVTTRFGAAGFHDSPLALPRIEVTGSDDLTGFIAKLPG
jgi:peptidoglycan/xylan/chitin deacetylase (PgdA/CDA1 family)